jgi:hypothetical protein
LHGESQCSLAGSLDGQLILGDDLDCLGNGSGRVSDEGLLVGAPDRLEMWGDSEAVQLGMMFDGYPHGLRDRGRQDRGCS